MTDAPRAERGRGANYKTNYLLKLFELWKRILSKTTDASLKL